MTMTREEYREFVFKEHEKTLRSDQRNAAVGSVVIFTGFYGRATYTKQEDGSWSREVN